MQPKISIVVPVYKVEQYLNQCVDSILAQTFSNFEVILVDDGSPDNCPAICDAYEEKDSRVKVIHKTNGGLMAAWIEGVNVSRGEYIGFVDSDDWVEPDMYEQMFMVAEREGVDIVQCDMVRNDEKQNICRIEKEDIYCCKQEISACVLPRLLTYWEFDNSLFINSRCNKLIRKTLVDSNIPYLDARLKWGEDLNAMIYFVLGALSIAIIPGSYYHYRTNRDSLVMQRYKDGYYDNYRFLKESVRAVTKAKHVDNYIQIMAQKCMFHIFLQVLANEFSNRNTVKSIRNLLDMIRAEKYEFTDCNLLLSRLNRRYRLSYFLVKTAGGLPSFKSIPSHNPPSKESKRNCNE